MLPNLMATSRRSSLLGGGGLQAENAEVWRRWRFTIAQAEAWKAVGVDEGLHAAQWSTAGVVAGTVAGVAGRGDRGAGGGPVARVRFRVGGGAGGEGKGLGPARAYAKSHWARREGSLGEVDGPLFAMQVLPGSPLPRCVDVGFP